MSQSTDTVPFRTKLRVEITNFLQKHRTLLLGLVIAAVVVVGGLAIWTEVDTATKAAYAIQIDKSQNDYTAWQTETDATKKIALGAAFEADLTGIQQSAPLGYGLSKSWFLQGNYLVAQKKWAEASKAFHSAFEKDPTGYLAPIALVNAGVSLEEARDVSGALGQYGEFEKSFSGDSVLAPQVFFTQGRLLESLGKKADAIAAYHKLLAKYPESGWTKLGRDRILLLNQE